MKYKALETFKYKISLPPPSNCPILTPGSLTITVNNDVQPYDQEVCKLNSASGVALIILGSKTTTRSPADYKRFLALKVGVQRCLRKDLVWKFRENIWEKIYDNVIFSNKRLSHRCFFELLLKYLEQPFSYYLTMMASSEAFKLVWTYLIILTCLAVHILRL